MAKYRQVDIADLKTGRHGKHHSLVQGIVQELVTLKQMCIRDRFKSARPDQLLLLHQFTPEAPVVSKHNLGPTWITSIGNFVSRTL